MKNKKLIIIFLIIISVVLSASYILYQDDLDANGKIYPSKEELCMHFAQSYLRTVQKTDNAHSSESIASPENQRWQIAIDVETDFYNLCMLNLEEKSLKMYKSTVIEKYQK